MQRVDKLWNDILEFQFDKQWSEYGFVLRLAKENYWTQEFTDQAILEYRKFMYLAATSDQMVSPSGVVDVVWHQHLVFTQSYQELCALIGKQVQHVPSTRNREDAEKFRQAKERTKKLYTESFGEAPKNIWDFPGMYESLNLEKAKFKLRSFLVAGLLSVLVLIIPFFFVLRPLYLKISGPAFMVMFLVVGSICFIGLALFNRDRIRSILDLADKTSFIYYLKPFELVYLKTKQIEDVINGVLNQLIINESILLQGTKLELAEKTHAVTIEEQQVLLELASRESCGYGTLKRALVNKPVFTNTASSMDAFRKYFNKSKRFADLFYLNFFVLAVPLLLALTRLVLGIMRDRPVFLLIIGIFLFILFSAAFLGRLISMAGSIVVPKLYQEELLTKDQISNNWEWSYFVIGSAMLTPAFAPLAQPAEALAGLGDSGSSSSGDGSCGSSCGSSCSSCGGCGGD